MRVAQDRWSTPRVLGLEHESPGTAGRPRGPLDQGPSRPGQLDDPAYLRIKCEWPGNVGRLRGTSDRSRPGHLVDTAVPQERPESCEIAGGPRGPWTRAGVTRDSWSTPQALGHGPESRGTAGQARRPSDPSPSHLALLVTPWAFGPGPQSPRRAGRPHGPSDTGSSSAGQLFEPAGHRGQA